MIILQIFILSWLITRFDPLQQIINYIQTQTKLKDIWFKLFRCMMCLSFWSTLIITHDIFIAATTSFISFWYDRLLGDYETFTKLN